MFTNKEGAWSFGKNIIVEIIEPRKEFYFKFTNLKGYKI